MVVPSGGKSKPPFGVPGLRVRDESHTLKTRLDLLEHRQPLANDASLVLQHAGKIFARPRQAHDEARANRIGDIHEHNRDHAALTLQRGGDPRRMCQDYVRLGGDQLFREWLILTAIAARESM